MTSGMLQEPTSCVLHLVPKTKRAFLWSCRPCSAQRATQTCTVRLHLFLQKRLQKQSPFQSHHHPHTSPNVSQAETIPPECWPDILNFVESHVDKAICELSTNLWSRFPLIAQGRRHWVAGANCCRCNESMKGRRHLPCAGVPTTGSCGSVQRSQDGTKTFRSR